MASLSATVRLPRSLCASVPLWSTASERNVLPREELLADAGDAGALDREQSAGQR